jgi:hypothetical protein
VRGEVVHHHDHVRPQGRQQHIANESIEDLAAGCHITSIKALEAAGNGQNS